MVLLPYYTALISEVGCGDLDYLQMQNRISAESGGIGVSFSVEGQVDNVNNLSGYMIFNGKALTRNRAALTELLGDVLSDARFDEHERIRELVAKIRARREQAVTANGHGLAMNAASQGISPGAWLAFRLDGLEAIRRSKSLDRSLDDPAELSAFCDRLASMHNRVRKQQRQFLLIAEDEQLQPMLEEIRQFWGTEPERSAEAWELAQKPYQIRQAWLTTTQVNFCSKAFPTVAVDHPDAAALSVLGGFLRNGYLHRAIREKGGAYGGGAGQDSVNGTFRFFSYRDPRLSETLDDFDQSLKWLENENHDAQDAEESILGVISQLDKPESPAGAASRAFHNHLFGRTPAQRSRFRERVLSVTIDDMKRVARVWLTPENASTAVITSYESRELAEKLGLELHEV